MREICRGVLAPGTKLSGSRLLAQEIGVNRQTVIAAYDELVAQGWLESAPRQGLFVAHHLPQVTPLPLLLPEERPAYPAHAAFAYKLVAPLPVYELAGRRSLSTMASPVRLTPLEALTRAYQAIARRPSSGPHLRYGSPQGSAHLRAALADDLRTTRGLLIGPEIF